MRDTYREDAGKRETRVGGHGEGGGGGGGGREEPYIWEGGGGLVEVIETERSGETKTKAETETGK